MIIDYIIIQFKIKDLYFLIFNNNYYQMKQNKKNGDLNLKILYEILTEFFKYEEILKCAHKNIDNEGYLIEKDALEEIKKKIVYDKLKSYSNTVCFPFMNFKKIFENKNLNKDLDIYIERNIIQVKFKNGEELIKSLNENKKYYFINKSLWLKICRNENANDNGIIFSLENKKYIRLDLDNEKLFFKINKGIIEQKSFIESKSDYKKHKLMKEEDKNLINNNNKFLSNNNIKFKKEIKLLIRLYYYHHYLKKKKFHHLNY